MLNALYVRFYINSCHAKPAFVIIQNAMGQPREFFNCSFDILFHSKTFKIFLQDWEGAKGELRDFGDAYGKRRNMEADVLERDSGVNSFNCPG